MKVIMKDALILCLITLIAGVFLGSVYFITKSPIKTQQGKAKQEAYQKVFEKADSFEAVDLDVVPDFEKTMKDGGFQSKEKQVEINEVVKALDASGNVLGYVITATSKNGYSGDIKLTVGIQADRTVNGIEFLTLKETAGLGMNALKDSFKGQYEGKNVDQFILGKGSGGDVVLSISIMEDDSSSDNADSSTSSDGQIDAMSGATITSSAITDAVNGAICYFNSLTAEQGVSNE